jgi:GTPase SAR1 family protein
MEILLVGNKNDLEDERVVTFDEGACFAKENGINFIEINAKDYNKVSEAFNQVASNIFKRIQ